MGGIPDSHFNPRAPYGARPVCCLAANGCFTYFNPRAPYGARPICLFGLNSKSRISIHAPHTGRDRINPNHQGDKSTFQSTRLIRGATTTQHQKPAKRHYFNPRAPYGARPADVLVRRGKALYFNPRAPYGARQQKCIIYVLHFCNNRQLKHKNQQETSSVRTFL